MAGNAGGVVQGSFVRLRSIIPGMKDQATLEELAEASKPAWVDRAVGQAPSVHYSPENAADLTPSSRFFRDANPANIGEFIKPNSWYQEHPGAKPT
jgi:hypothetical protein